VISVGEIEAILHRLFIGDPSAALRDEDRQKARELTVVLDEIARAAPRSGTLVDAAAGKGAVGLTALATVLDPKAWRLVAIERDPRRVELLRAAAGDLSLEAHACDVDDAAAWPEEPTVVVGLHACGLATDAIIDRAVAAQARHLLLVPCCYGGMATHADAARPVDPYAHGWADAMGVRPGVLRASLARTLTDTERTLRLEAAGYETTVIDAIPAAVTPFGRLWRARRVYEPVRMARARDDLDRLRGGERR
jgi:threonine dehydrogenase-like Zn-dependent dehydrogenase